MHAGQLKRWGKIRYPILGKKNPVLRYKAEERGKKTVKFRLFNFLNSPQVFYPPSQPRQGVLTA